MSQMYRVALCSGVAMAALALSAPTASAQTSVTQSTNNSAAVSNPTAGTNTIDLGGGGLGTGASVSTSAGGAVSSTSITGINSHFVNPADPPASVRGDPGRHQPDHRPHLEHRRDHQRQRRRGTRLVARHRRARRGEHPVGHRHGRNPVPDDRCRGRHRPGHFAGGRPGSWVRSAVGNDAPVTNTGEITGPSGGPALNLSGTGASASVSATGALSAVSWTALDATGFTGTNFNIIQQAPRNSNTGGGPVGVFNTLSANGISLGAISGDGASVSATATGAAAAVSFSYVNTADWSGVTIGSIVPATEQHRHGDRTTAALPAYRSAPFPETALRCGLAQPARPPEFPSRASAARGSGRGRAWSSTAGSARSSSTAAPSATAARSPAAGRAA